MMGTYYPYVTERRTGSTPYCAAYKTKKIRDLREIPLNPDQSKPLHSVSLFELIDTSTGIN